MGLPVLAAGLLTTFLLIVAGAVLRNRLRFRDTFWEDLERLAYWVLLPALLVRGLAGAEFAGIAVDRAVAVLLGSALVAALLALLAGRLVVGRDGPAFTSVFQGTVRFNNYIGLTVVTTLFGSQGLSLAALANAVLVPAGNIMSILVLARYGRQGTTRPRVVRAVLTNPLVMACALGLLLNLISGTRAAAALTSWPGTRLLTDTGSTLLEVLGSAALPVGLLCVGAGLRVPAAWGAVARVLAWSLVLRLVLVPAATLVLCRLFGLAGAAAVTVVVFAALPTAPSSYVLARRLGGDAPLMANITATQTVATFVTLPLWILLGRTLA